MLTKEFFEAVHSENTVLVRIMMKDSLLVDPSFHDFREMEKETALMKDLYEPHDGGDLEESSENWTVEYMNEQMADVVLNFSRERMEHLQKVVRFLYPVQTIAKPSMSTTSKMTGNSSSKGMSSPSQRRTHSQRKSDPSMEKLLIGVVAGGVIGGVIASLASVTVVGGTVVGAVTGGAVMAVKEKGGR